MVKLSHLSVTLSNAWGAKKCVGNYYTFFNGGSFGSLGVGCLLWVVNCPIDLVGRD